MKVVANICSYYDIIDGKDELPEMVDTGHEVKRVINGNNKKKEVGLNRREGERREGGRKGGRPPPPPPPAPGTRVKKTFF